MTLAVQCCNRGRPFRRRAKKSVELTVAIVPAGTSFPAVWQDLSIFLAKAAISFFDQLNSVPSRPLLEARKAVEQQVSELDRKVVKLVRRDAQVRRFMTVPGVGPITALAFKATIDDPARFARSRRRGCLCWVNQ